MQIVFYIIVALSILSFIIIGVFDDLTATIPHTITIILMLLGLSSIFIDQSPDKVWWLPLTIASIIFVIQVLLFVIMGENAIGGGDIKILTICCFFVHSIDKLYTWAIYFSIATVLALVVSKTHKDNVVRMGKFICLPIIPVFFSSRELGLEIIVLYLVLIYAIDILLERRIPNEEKQLFQQDYKKQKRR